MDSPVCCANTICVIGISVFLLQAGVFAQTEGRPQSELKLDWRRIGNSSIFHPTGDLATGPVDRVWFAGSSVAAQLRSGEVWELASSQIWAKSTAQPPETAQRQAGGRSFRIYGDLLRSEDEGQSWVNLTSYRGNSILGGPLSDVAVSPSNPDQIVVAGADGVWMSSDGGVTWAGLNEGLPNLPVERIADVPAGPRGVRVVTDTSVLEWRPGQKAAWTKIATNPGTPGIVSAARGDFVYLGFADGRVQVTAAGVTRPAFRLGSEAVESIWVDATDPNIALAISGPRLYRTFNGGGFWDDVTGTLVAGRLHGVTADRGTKSIYVAGDGGVFYGRFEFVAVGAASTWQEVRGAALPKAKAVDVKLDAGANQLYAAIEGYGVFATMAPHRRQHLAVVSAADSTARPAAPGALLSVIGQSVASVRTNGRAVPVLAAIGGETQLQVPFDVQGRELPLRLEAGTSRWDLSLPLESASPAVFVDGDGSPMILDADSGVLLDAMNPARSTMRIQILATGLGRVRPDWPAGREAPLDDPPAVVAPVQVYLDGEPLSVTRATLAPGYVGFYLIEIEMPALVNAGTAELFVEVEGRTSNRVRVYIEP